MNRPTIMVVLENIRCKLITENICGQYFSRKLNVKLKRKIIHSEKKKEKNLSLKYIWNLNMNFNFKDKKRASLISLYNIFI